MLILMGGLPKAGKTTVVDLIRPHVDVVVSPGYGVDAESEELRKQQYLAAWRKGVSKVTTFCAKNGGRILLFDSTGSNVRQLMQWKVSCDSHGVEILYVLVHALKQQCIDRGAEMSLLLSYVVRLQQCVPLFKNNLVVIKNIGSLEDLKEATKPLVRRLQEVGHQDHTV